MTEYKFKRVPFWKYPPTFSIEIKNVEIASIIIGWFIINWNTNCQEWGLDLHIGVV